MIDAVNHDLLRKAIFELNKPHSLTVPGFWVHDLCDVVFSAEVGSMLCSFHSRTGILLYSLASEDASLEVTQLKINKVGIILVLQSLTRFYTYVLST